MSTHSHSKVRTRRRQRGVAMVEAVAIFPIFVVLWLTCLYAFNIGAKKIESNTTSRANAWAYSMGNCGMPSSDPAATAWPGGGWGSAYKNNDLFSLKAGQFLGNSKVSGIDIVGALTTIIADFLPGVGTSVSAIEKEERTVAFVVPHDGVVSPGSSSSKTLHYTTSIFCNEPVHNGSIKGVIADIITMIRSIL
jgi:hypothetical protein